MTEKTVEEYVALADHYLAIGMKDISLWGNSPRIFSGGLPWDKVSEIKAGGTSAGYGPINLFFKAYHPCGLSFSWYFDLVPYEARGKEYFSTERILQISKLLPTNEARLALADAIGGEILEGIQKWQNDIANQYHMVTVAATDMMSVLYKLRVEND